MIQHHVKLEDDVKTAVHSLKTASDNLFCWFASNQMESQS